MKGNTPSEQSVLTQLRRVLESKHFSGSPRLSQFLAYAVEHSLRGESAALKEVCIGAAVFGKPPSYDPKAEPIVRVEARRLRARLEEYYASRDKEDCVRIELPKGSYQAQFQQLVPMGQDPQPVVSAAEDFNNPTQAPHLVEQPQPPLKSRRLRPLFTLALSLVFGVLICVTLIMLGTHMRGVQPLRYTHVAPLTSYTGNQLEPSISHDGRQLAFVWGGEDGSNYDIYVKLMDVGTPVRLTTDPAHDLYPQWSPDDRYLSFIRVSEHGMSLLVVPALGGGERKLVDLRLRSPWKGDVLQMQAGVNAVWSSDGRELIFTDQFEDDPGTAALFAISLDGSTRRRITAPHNLNHDYQAATSHDGRHIAFVRETSNASGDVFVADAEGQHLYQVTFDRMAVHGITWTPGDQSIVFASNRGGADALWQVHAQGGDPVPIPAGGAEITTPSLSADGRVLAYTSTGQNWNIWRAPISGTSLPAAPSALITSHGRNDSPRYSPDGKRIAFVSDRSGSWEIWTSDNEGRDLRQITSFNGPVVGTPRWSPDSEYLVFDARPQGRSAIYTVAENGGTPRAVVQDAFENKKPSWSQDGKRLYYASNHDGVTQLWSSDLRGEHAKRLTQMRCDDSLESRDGKFIYLQNEEPGLWRMPTTGGSPALVKGLEHVSPMRYFDVSDQIYYLDQDHGLTKLERFDFTNGQSQALVRFDRQPVYGTPSLSISPDGRYLLFAQQDSSNSQIMALTAR